jgi:hypothetical protein
MIEFVVEYHACAIDPTRSDWLLQRTMHWSKRLNCSSGPRTKAPKNDEEYVVWSTQILRELDLH